MHSLRSNIVNTSSRTLQWPRQAKTASESSSPPVKALEQLVQESVKWPEGGETKLHESADQPKQVLRPSWVQ